MSFVVAADARGTQQVQMSLRLPADLAEALEEKAKSEDRTVSAELRRIIRRHVAPGGAA